MRKLKYTIIKITFLVICMFVIKNKIHSQPYIPMLNGYAEWHVTNCYFGCTTDKYYTIGDTVIDNYHYKFLDLYHYNKNFVVREDTLTRKVYMRLLAETGHAREYVLYDFAANVNDTISVINPGSPYPKYAGSFVVDSIKLQALVTKNHRYFYLHSLDTLISNTKNTIWVEGIGSLCLINTPGAMAQINGVGQLSCFFNNGVNEYQQLDSISDCVPVYPLGLKEQNTIYDVTVSQNFNNESISITSLKNNFPFTLCIYNIEGQAIFLKEKSILPIIDMYIGNLTKGVLLLKLETDKQHYTTFKIFNP